MKLFYEKLDSLKYWVPQLIISSCAVLLVSGRVSFVTSSSELSIKKALLLGMIDALAIILFITLVLTILKYCIFTKKEEKTKGKIIEMVTVAILSAILKISNYCFVPKLRREIPILSNNMQLFEFNTDLILNIAKYSSIIMGISTILILARILFFTKEDRSLKGVLGIVINMVLINFLIIFVGFVISRYACVYVSWLSLGD